MRKQLDETHTWPCDFMFKFIVPKANENEAALRAIFGLKARFKVKYSKTGKYRSFTVVDNVDSADAVLRAMKRLQKSQELFLFNK